MNREDSQRVITKWCEEELYPPEKTKAINEYLYDNGYVLLSPEEVKRVDSALLLWSNHGMDHVEEK